jgi:hypothetical protein
MMKEMSFDELKQIVNSKREQIDRDILRHKSDERNVRRRPREHDEIRILDQLCVDRWKQAEQSGKVKYLSEKEWYYEPID